MTEKQILKQINSIIGDANSWIEFYLNGQNVGGVTLSNKCDFTKKEILNGIDIRFEEEINGKNYFRIWFHNTHGWWCCFYFNECKIKSY